MSTPPFHFATAERLRRVFLAERDLRLVARAVAAGLVSESQVAEARRLRDGGTAGLLTEILAARGWLPADALARVQEEEAREEFGRASSGEQRRAPDEAEAWARDPDRQLGEFILVARQGSGGSAEVWKAWDRKLGRWVAIKISTLSIESAEARGRFEREALAAGRLAHPQIVPVFQVGHARGKPFLVMPFIDGRTLDQLPVTTLPVRRALEIVCAAARAVDHAHRNGIIHRDLKPGNVMVDGGGGVFVVDFGLAYLKEDSLSRLTRPGEVMGTASYMAPEQARGGTDGAEAAIDVYGLGATLYYLITGRAPFTGSSLEVVIGRVLTADPEPPGRVRQPLDPRVDLVVMRALEKDPRNRHPSAAALADDLQRILDDRAVPVPKRIRQQGRLRARSLLGVVAVLGLVAIGATATVRARFERRTSIEALGSVARLSLDTALRLRRAGDTAGMRQLLPEVTAAYDRVAARGAQSAEGEYLMGRMYRALLDEDRALPHIQRALSLDAAYAPALYERAVLMSHRYGHELAAAVGAIDGHHRLGPDTITAVETRTPEMAALRRQILDDCTRLATLAPGRARAAAARGILAYHRGEIALARAQLEPAVAQDPLLEEAWETLADVTKADSSPALVEEIYTRALALDRGYVPLLVGRCGVFAFQHRTALAIADAGAALAIEPSSFEARACRAGALLDDAHDLMMKGGDNTRLLAAAEADGDAALALRKLPAALWQRAAARRYRGMFRVRRGEDPSADFAAAVGDLDRLVALGPGDAWGLQGRGRTRTRHALYLLSVGKDAVPELTAALADLSRAVALDPGAGTNHAFLADVNAGLGLADLARKQPDDTHFATAEANFADAVRVGYGGTWLYLYRGIMRTGRGLARAAVGGDPTPDWAGAEADLVEATRQVPAYADPASALGRLRLERGLYLQRQRNRRAHAELTAAAQELDRAVAIDPLLVEARQARDRLCREVRALCGSGQTRGDQP